MGYMNTIDAQKFYFDVLKKNTVQQNIDYE